MKAPSLIPSPILESLEGSDQMLQTTLSELAEDKRKRSPKITERKLAEYLADQMGYRGPGNVKALVESRVRIAKSRQQLGLNK